MPRISGCGSLRCSFPWERRISMSFLNPERRVWEQRVIETTSEKRVEIVLPRKGCNLELFAIHSDSTEDVPEDELHDDLDDALDDDEVDFEDDAPKPEDKEMLTEIDRLQQALLDLGGQLRDCVSKEVQRAEEEIVCREQPIPAALECRPHHDESDQCAYGGSLTLSGHDQQTTTAPLLAAAHLTIRGHDQQDVTAPFLAEHCSGAEAALRPGQGGGATSPYSWQGQSPQSGMSSTSSSLALRRSMKADKWAHLRPVRTRDLVKKNASSVIRAPEQDRVFIDGNLVFVSALPNYLADAARSNPGARQRSAADVRSDVARKAKVGAWLVEPRQGRPDLGSVFAGVLGSKSAGTSSGSPSPSFSSSSGQRASRRPEIPADRHIAPGVCSYGPYVCDGADSPESPGTKIQRSAARRSVTYYNVGLSSLSRGAVDALAPQQLFHARSSAVPSGGQQGHMNRGLLERKWTLCSSEASPRGSITETCTSSRVFSISADEDDEEEDLGERLLDFVSDTGSPQSRPSNSGSAGHHPHVNHVHHGVHTAAPAPGQAIGYPCSSQGSSRIQGAPVHYAPPVRSDAAMMGRYLLQ
eukprot:TRINITY_DN36082_c0_g1_i3.p1 TRINITY_DN36082_c0_g1~~TRINITY_DN36082_c0_g1_i3.p1  ORF type:complete len:584 (-),score=71.06 TRINITY_DN36082_c0_g1_i3:291-2042(-)